MPECRNASEWQHACSAEFWVVLSSSCSLEQPIHEELLVAFNQRYLLFCVNSCFWCASVEENWCVLLLVTIYPDKTGVPLFFFRREFLLFCVLFSSIGFGKFGRYFQSLSLWFSSAQTQFHNTASVPEAWLLVQIMV